MTDQRMNGKVAPDGRLVEADAGLLALHARLGGEPGGILPLPAIGALIRLVVRLNVPMSRPVQASDGDTGIDLWVRAKPEEGGVALGISIISEDRPPDRDDPKADFDRAIAEYSWSIDAALTLTALSRAAADAMGIGIASALGQPFTRLFSLVEGEGGAMPMVEALAGHLGFTGQIARMRGSDVGLISLSGRPILGSAQEFLGYRGSANRIDEIPPVEPADAPISTGAQEEAVLGEQLGVALKMPLKRIVENADSISALSDGPLRAGYAGYAADIAVAGRHLLGLVDDLVELQMIDRPDFAPLIEDIDLADIARRAVGLLGVRAADSHVKIDRPGETETLPARGEYRRVLQILVNLIGNAIRYSPVGGTIWVRAEGEGDIAAIIVADQGKGIPEDHHERIFGKFERVDANEPGGSGLGLYISRRLARVMGGDITVDSAPGQGARFILTLPAA